MERKGEKQTKIILLILKNKTVEFNLIFETWWGFMEQYVCLKTLSRKKDALEKLADCYGENIEKLIFATHLLTYIIAKENLLIRRPCHDFNDIFGKSNPFEDALSTFPTNDYEDIKHLVLKSFSLDEKDDLYSFMERVYRDILPTEIRKPLGEYFTPLKTAQDMVRRCMKNCSDTDLWTDNACGFGVFLLAFCKSYSKEEAKRFYCFDVNPLSVIITKIIFADFFGYDMVEYLNVIWGDFLLEEQYIYKNSKIEKRKSFDQYRNRFAIAIGNPPWVAWKSLSNKYQDLIGDDWRSYDLFNTKISRASYGSCNDDISSFFIYKTIDFLLRDDGRLVYLVNLTLFRSESSGEEFRKYNILKSNTAFKINYIIDYGGCKIFPGVTNTYCEFEAIRGKKNEYPIKYIIAKDNLETTASPTSAKNSALEIKRDGDFLDVNGKNYYKARAGVCTWLNGVYWVEMDDDDLCTTKELIKIKNLGDCGKKKVTTVEAEIESELIYKSLRARNLEDFSPAIDNYIIIPQCGHDLSKPINEDEFFHEYPNAAAYFNIFKQDLLLRSGYDKFLSGKPFFSLYNIGDYTKAPIKLCWQFISKKFRVFIVNDAERIIPDLNVMFIPLEDYDESLYLYAILNSKHAIQKIESSSNWTFSAGAIKKIRVDKYDKNNILHKQIVQLQKQAFGSANQDEALIEQLEGLFEQYWS